MRAPNPGDDTYPPGQTQPRRGPWRNTRTSGKAGVAPPSTGVALFATCGSQTRAVERRAVSRMQVFRVALLRRQLGFLRRSWQETHLARQAGACFPCRSSTAAL